jgi:hypothetical protein
LWFSAIAPAPNTPIAGFAFTGLCVGAIPPGDNPCLAGWQDNATVFISLGIHT